VHALVLYGSASAPGRLFEASRALAGRFAAAGASADVLDLHATPLDWADGRPLDAHRAPTREAVAAVEAADVVALASPVYRGAAPGVLKNLLDLLPVEALRGKPVGIVAMGAAPGHALGVDHDLRPVLAWFGALLAPTGVYLTGADFEQGEVSAAAVERLGALAQTLASLEAATRGTTFGPPPDGAWR
jgi:NAD(P)H-dependent FMN reductase